jgi:YesN/AraC family two-component response regulator
VPQTDLIADDRGTIRRVLKMFLEDRKNIKVGGEAENGSEAVSAEERDFGFNKRSRRGARHN